MGIDGELVKTEEKARLIDYTLAEEPPFGDHLGSGSDPYYGWTHFQGEWEVRYITVTANSDKMTVAFKAQDMKGSCGCMLLDQVELVPKASVSAKGWGAMPYTPTEYLTAGAIEAVTETPAMP